MIVARFAAGASSGPRGFFITGGYTKTGLTSSTEVLTHNGWEAGPDLPLSLASHCQVSVGSKVIIAGWWVAILCLALTVGIDYRWVVR